MSGACCDVPSEKAGVPVPSVCPTCGGPGKPVALGTVKAMLNSMAMRRLDAGESFRFCAQPDCQTVYYGARQVFTRIEVREPVFQKESGPQTPVCYCFGYRREDLAETGARKETMAKIGALVKAGSCACETRNPQGSCCLGNVASVGKKAPEASVSARGGPEGCC
jgi:hypothetical protein